MKNPASSLSRLCQVKGYSVGALGNTKQKVSFSSLWLYHLGQQRKTDPIQGLGRGWLCGASGREWSLFRDHKPSGHFQPDLGKLPWGWFCSLNKRLWGQITVISSLTNVWGPRGSACSQMPPAAGSMTSFALVSPLLSWQKSSQRWAATGIGHDMIQLTIL